MPIPNGEEQRTRTYGRTTNMSARAQILCKPRSCNNDHDKRSASSNNNINKKQHLILCRIKKPKAGGCVSLLLLVIMIKIIFMGMENSPHTWVVTGCSYSLQVCGLLTIVLSY
jgi:hypothetical protein